MCQLLLILITHSLITHSSHILSSHILSLHTVSDDASLTTHPPPYKAPPLTYTYPLFLNIILFSASGCQCCCLRIDTVIFASISYSGRLQFGKVTTTDRVSNNSIFQYYLSSNLIILSCCLMSCLLLLLLLLLVFVVVVVVVVVVCLFVVVVVVVVVYLPPTPSLPRRTRTRALLGTASQSVLVQMTVTSSSTSQNLLLSLNNAIGNGLLTTALTTGQHTLSTHSINTLYQHTLATHPNNTPYQHPLSTHPINTLYQHTLSTHPFNTPQTYLSIHFFDLSFHNIVATPHQHTLSTHPFTTPFQHILSIHSINTPQQCHFIMHPTNTQACLSHYSQLPLTIQP